MAPRLAPGPLGRAVLVAATLAHASASLHPCASELEQCVAGMRNKAGGDNGDCLLSHFETLSTTCQTWLALAQRISAVNVSPRDPSRPALSPQLTTADSMPLEEVLRGQWLMSLIEGAPLPLLLLLLTVLPLLVRSPTPHASHPTLSPPLRGLLLTLRPADPSSVIVSRVSDVNAARRVRRALGQ